MGGSLGVTGKYDTQDTLNPKIDVSLDVNDMVINEVFSTVETAKKIVPLFSDAEGNFSLSMDLKSNMDATLTPILETVNAKGSFNSKDISLKNVEAFSALAEKTGMDLFKKPNLKNLSIAFEIKDGRLHIDPFETLISMTKLNVSGSSGLDQTLDYVAKIQLPENVSKVVDLIFDMKIGGTFSKPKISFGASSIKEQVKEKVTEVVDKAKEAAIAAAKEQKEKLVAAAQAQRDKLVATAQESADKLVAKAEAERDKNVANAKNPIAKAAAQKAGDALVKKTKEQADKMVSDANKSGDKLVSDAEKSGNALIEKASAGK
jgi:vacuolar-type H+-ATPase subunit H